jgi:Arc/MetJ-type ribon-helix-helix transcriptional regulator
MRPQIPDQLEEQVEAVAEQGGYSSGSELVRDAVRRRVDELEKHPSDRTVRKWLEREKRIQVISGDTFPAVEFNEETGETTTIEGATWSILLRTFNIPVWVFGGLQSEPLKITCSVLKHLFSDVDENVLLEGPGYLVGLSSENRSVDTVSGADGIQLEKQLSRGDLSRGELINTVLGMGGTIEMAVDGKPPFERMVTGWEQG